MSRGLLLIDGNACIWWATFAVSPLLGVKGRLQEPPHRFLGFVLRLLRSEKPGYLAVLLEDSPGPGNFLKNLPTLQTYLSALGVPVLHRPTGSVPGLVRSLLDRSQAARLNTLLVSTRRSLLRWVDSSVTLMNPAREGLRFDPARVETVFGVPPSQVPDWLILTGDPAEGIPGVKGIGPKTASGLLKRYGSLEGILSSLEGLTGSLKKRLEASRERIRGGERHLKIDPAPFSDLTLEVCRFSPPDPQRLTELFGRAGMIDLIPELLPHSHPRPVRYETVLRRDQLLALRDRLGKADRFALDTETTGLNTMQDELVGISIAIEKDEAFYLPLGHRYPSAPEQLPLSFVGEVLGPIFLDPAKLKIGQNLKFDLAFLQRAGFEVKGPLFDTLVASYLLNPDRKSHSLDALSLAYFGYKMIPFQELLGQAKTMAEVDIPRVTEYACEDADLTFQLHERLSSELDRLGFAWLFREVEMPYGLYLAQMEGQGVLIDQERLENLLSFGQERASALAEEIFSLAGERFDLNSPQNLRRILLDRLKLPFTHKTRGRQLSLSADSLRAMISRHPIVPKLLEYQSWVRLVRQRLLALTTRLDPSTGRWHLSAHPAGTGSGELRGSSFFRSSGSPDFDERLRSLVRAPTGHVLLAARYLQLESRLMAHGSRDPELIKRFGQGGTPLEDRQVRAFPSVQQLFKRWIVQAKREGRVVTLLKRIRPLPALNSPNPVLRQAAEREALETILKGSVADLVKLSVVRVRQLLEEAPGSGSFVQILPDGILLEIVQERWEDWAVRIQQVMEQVIRLRVPLAVELSSGPYWDELTAAHLPR